MQAHFGPSIGAASLNREFTLWALDGDNGLPNNLIMIEAQDCLEAVYILPPSYMLPMFAKAELPKFETLIKSGALTVYSLPIDRCQSA